jgi:CubicO group peptidase (beta-lactamase class C family)
MPIVLMLCLLVLLGAPAAGADAIDDYIKVEMERRRIPGLALAVVRGGTLVKLQGYGLANLEHDVRVTPDTVFELASVTKQFTATAIMALVEDGKVQLDEPIPSYLPNAPETWKAITVRHLLTHTSGLPGLAEGFKALRPGGLRWNYTTAQMFAAAAKDTLSFEPGTRFQYSDVGYFLLGMIIESASGQRYRDFLDTRFFRPLGMTATSVLDHFKILKHRAAGYTLRDGELVNIRRTVQVELPSHFGIFSTVKDLVTWEAALSGGRVVKPATLAQMWAETRLNEGSTYPYGFGWFVGERRGHRWITHGGITGTELSRFPDDDLTVVVLTNLGRWVGGDRVNSWGITYGVAGRYMPGLHVGAEPTTPDPTPARTAGLRALLEAVARGEGPALLNPKFRSYLGRDARGELAESIATLRDFIFVTCDEGRPIERFGMQAQRVCHYRMVNAAETRYYSFWLTDDDHVAAFWSSTE